jgi:hypothetical protein
MFLCTPVEHASSTVQEVLTLGITATKAVLIPDTARMEQTSQCIDCLCCKVEADLYSSGCGNTMPSGSYGKTFNANKGGVYATWLTKEAVKIWWFPRNSIPADIKNGSPEPNTWGQPATTQFVNANGNCDVGRYFKKQTIVR